MSNDNNTDDKNPANEMTFLEHLEEMRSVILKSLAVFSLAFLFVIMTFYYFNKIMLCPLNWAKDILAGYVSVSEQTVEETPKQTRVGPVYLVSEKNGAEEKQGPFYIVSENGNLLLSKDQLPQQSNQNSWIADIKLRSMSITTPIYVWISVGFLGSLGLSLPIIMFFVARFIMPGLTKAELRMLTPGVIVGTTLFFIGSAFAFRFMLPMGIAFMAYMSNGMQLEMFPDAMSYYTMVIFVTIATGLTFELPLLEFILIYLGVLNVKWLKENRRMVFLIIIVFAAVVTPPDVITQISLSVPLYLLYEIALRCGIIARKRKLAKEAEQRRKEDAQEEIEHREFVKEEARRRLAEQEKENYEQAKALTEKDSASYPEEDDYSYFDDRAYEELDNLEDDYGLDNYDDYDSPDGYINYGSLAKPTPDFSPDWSLNDPDTSFMTPDWNLNIDSGKENPSDSSDSSEQISNETVDSKDDNANV